MIGKAVAKDSRLMTALPLSSISSFAAADPSACIAKSLLRNERILQSPSSSDWHKDDGGDPHEDNDGDDGFGECEYWHNEEGGDAHEHEDDGDSHIEEGGDPHDDGD